MFAIVSSNARKVLYALALVGCVVIVPFAQASGPSSNRTLNYQLRLNDTSGNPVADGPIDIKLTFFTAPSGGTQLHTACSADGSPTGTPTAVTATITNSNATVLIGDTGVTCASGSAVAIPTTLFNATAIYLGVTVEADAEMTPRKRVVATGYALNADRLDDLETSDAGGTAAYVPVTDASGNITITGNPTGSAAVITANPAAAQISANDLLIAGRNNGTAVFTVDAEGDVIIAGNTTLGDASTDTITFTAQAASSLVPSVDDTYDLGSNTNRWRDLYLGPATLHIGTNGDEARIGYDTVENRLTFDANGDGIAESVLGTGGFQSITGSGALQNAMGGLGQFQNMLNGSSGFGGSAWTRTGGVTAASGQASPDGSTDGDLMSDDGTGGGTYEQTKTISVAASQPYTFSVWIKDSTTTSTISIAITDLNGTGGTTTTKVIDPTTEWQRYSVTHTPPSDTTSIKVVINHDSAASTAFRAFGSQLEKGTEAGPYVNTQDGGNGGGRTFGASINGDLVVAGYGEDSEVPITGDGTRMMFLSGYLGAFRAGIAESGSWDAANIGLSSAAFGYGNFATTDAATAVSGRYNDATGLDSLAGGYESTASGAQSFAYGDTSTASGLVSLALGDTALASGTSAIALGELVTASQSNAIAMGRYVTASASGSMAIGYGVSNGSRLSNSTANSLAIGFNSTVPTLMVTAGSGAGTYGNVGIGDSTPLSLFTVGSGDRLRIDAAGNVLTHGSISSPMGGLGLIQNKLTAASNFGSGSWTRTGGVIATSGQSSPDGSTDADLMSDDGTGGGTYEQTVTIPAVASQPHTFSVWIKDSTTVGTLSVQVTDLNGTGGTTSTTTFDPTTDWQRYSVTHTPPSDTTSIKVVINHDSTASDAFYAFGAQLEKGAAPGPYYNTNDGGLATNQTFGMSVNGSLLVGGNESTVPVTGAGQRLMFIPGLEGAFRAGFVNGTQWNSIGIGSVAFGRNTTASGDYSFAFGDTNTASNYATIAGGFNNTASGSSAIALGYENVASATEAISFGKHATADDVNAILIGRGTSGVSPLTSPGSDTFSVGFNSTVPTLVVTAGSGAGTYGNVGIGTINPLTTLEVNGTFSSPTFGFGRYENRLKYTERFENAVWTKESTIAITTNSGTYTAPNGTSTADRVTTGGASATNGITQPSSDTAVTASTTWTGSVWMRAESGTATVNLRISSGNETGTVAAASLNTSWQRFRVTQAFTGASTGTATFRIETGTATGIVLWGAQLEKASAVGPYVAAEDQNMTSPHNGIVGGTLNDANRLTGSLLVDGYGSFPANASHNNVKMMWIPDYIALRAGDPAGTSTWSEANTGYGSVAFGEGNTASGSYTFAHGRSNTASGLESFVFGTGNTANAYHGVAFGDGNTAGNEAFALGNTVTATGTNSVGFGKYISSTGTRGIVLGSGISSGSRLSSSATDTLAVGFNSTVPTFVVTAGSGAGTYGNVGIGLSYPQERLHVGSTSTTPGTGNILAELGNIESPLGGLGVFENRIASNVGLFTMTNLTRGTVTDPYGINSANSLTDDNNGGTTSEVTYTVTGAASTTYTFSVWLRNVSVASADSVTIAIRDDGTSPGTTTRTITGAEMPSSSYRRFTVTHTAAAGTANITVVIGHGTSNSDIFNVWRSQMVVGFNPKAFVTRDGADANVSGYGLSINNAYIYDGSATVTGSTGAELNLFAPGSGDDAYVKFQTDGATWYAGGDSAGSDSFSIGTSSTLSGNALTLTSGGNLGIGDSSPASLLTVGSSDAFQVNSSGAITASTGITTSGNTTLGDAIGDTFTAHAGAWTLVNDTAVTLSGGLDGLNFDANTLSIDAANNRIGIGTAAPNSPLHVKTTASGGGVAVIAVESGDGICYISSDGTNGAECASDRTLKKDFASIEGSLGMVRNLAPTYFRMLGDDNTDPVRAGFIAQEVKEVLPNLVHERQWIDGSTKNFLSMGGMMPYLVGAIQELDTRDIYVGRPGYAESFPSQETLLPGELVMIDTENLGNVRRADANTSSYLVAGVVASEETGFLAGPSDVGNYPVIDSGKASVKVTAENGAIAVGDAIVVSNGVPGAGMKATQNGHIVGIALEAWGEEGIGTIAIYLNRGWWNGETVESGNFDGSDASNLTVISGPVVFEDAPLIGVHSIEGSGGEWHIDAGGFMTMMEITADKVTAKEFAVKMTDAAQTAGKDVILTGSRAAVVSNPVIKADSQIFVTFRNDPGSRWWIDEQHDGSFIIMTTDPVQNDVSFSYWILGVTDERTPPAEPEVPVSEPPVSEAPAEGEPQEPEAPVEEPSTEEITEPTPEVPPETEGEAAV